MPYPAPPRFSGAVHRHYWSERAHERTEFLTELVDRLGAERVPTEVHEGWTRDDLTIFPHGWTDVSVRTVQEDHSGGRRLLRVRLRLAPNGQTAWALGGAAALALVAAVTPAPLAAALALSGAAALVVLAGVAWKCGLDRRARLVGLADGAAAAVGLLSMQPGAATEPEPTAEPEPTEAAPDESVLAGTTLLVTAPGRGGAAGDEPAAVPLDGVLDGARSRALEPAGA